MGKNILMMLLTLIMLSVAIYGKMVESNINENASSVVNDMLKPQPWLSKSFDYYGTPIQSNFTGVFDSIKVKENLKYIKQWRVSRDSVWSAYLKGNMSANEKALVDKVNNETKEADKLIDELIKNVEDNKNLKYNDSIVKSGQVDKLINPCMDDINALIDLQSSEGEVLVSQMQSTLKTFSNFMIGVLSLSFILFSSLVYQYYKDNIKPQPKKRIIRKSPVKKKVTPKKK